MAQIAPLEGIDEEKKKKTVHRVCGAQPSVPSCLSDLEKSVEEIQKESSVNHKLVTVQELEEKSAALRKLGETLTELKSESRRLICSFIYA